MTKARTKRARTRGPRTPEPPAPTRQEQVLDAALALIAERGVAGASLRALAAELGMSQPSLYHYFASKDDLVRQIVDNCADKMLDAAPIAGFPTRFVELPRFVADGVLQLWSGERHPRFTRFLFVVAIESPLHRATIQRVFEERLYGGMPAIGAAYGLDGSDAEDLGQTLRMVVSAIGLALLEERALFGMPRPSEKTLRYADWVVAAGERLLRDLERDIASRGRRPRR